MLFNNVLNTSRWATHSAGNVLERFMIPVYFVSIAALYASYFVIFFKLVDIPHKYVAALQSFVHVFVCLFLLVRFNPLIHPVLHKNDSDIIFASAVLLLSNVVFIHPEKTISELPGASGLKSELGL